MRPNSIDEPASNNAVFGRLILNMDVPTSNRLFVWISELNFYP